MKTYDILGFSISIWIIVPVIYGALITAGWTVKKVLFVWLAKLTEKTETQLDDIVIASANAPITVMIFVWSATFTFHILPDTPANWTHYVVIGSKIATIAAG